MSCLPPGYSFEGNSPQSFGKKELQFFLFFTRPVFQSEEKINASSKHGLSRNHTGLQSSGLPLKRSPIKLYLCSGFFLSTPGCKTGLVHLFLCGEADLRAKGQPG